MGTKHPFEEHNASEGAGVNLLNIHIEGHELRQMDTLSKSDPFVVMFRRGAGNGEWIEVGRTETVMNCSDPKFVKSFDMPYVFEALTEISLEVYDRDSPSNNLTKHDYMGSVTTTLAQIVTSPGGIVTLELKNELAPRKRMGFLTLVGEEVGDERRTIYMDLGFRVNKKSDSKLYQYVIQRYREDGGITPLYTSTASRAFQNTYRFPSCVMRAAEMTGGVDTRELRIDLLRESGRGKYDSVGHVKTSVKDLLQLSSEGEIDLLAPDNSKNSKQKTGKRILKILPGNGKISVSAGTLICYKLNVVKEAHFLDYIAGGCKLHVSMAIDFTSSNGDPRQPGTHHYVDLQNPNPYEQSIRTACNIMDSYAADRKYSMYGFGARLPPSWTTSHCFPLGYEEKHEAYGLDGVLRAYRQSVGTVQLHGPTIFSEILEAVCCEARKPISQLQQFYHVLFIFTDGVIADMAKTIEKLVNASTLPLSVVIVGIGDEDFSKMEILDADSKVLSSNGKEATRDIVQFVSLNQCGDDMDLLAKEMLKEIPDQVTEFFTQKKIKPNIAT